ncbi:Nitrogen-sensing and cell-morphology modulator, general aminoacid permease, putative, partial [Candida maltosa Xu316]
MSSHEEKKEDDILSSPIHTESRESLPKSSGNPVSNFVRSFKVQKDLEVGFEDISTPEDSLKDYQVKLIALSSCIGSGMFVASASAISAAGAGGTVLGYCVIAILMFLIIQSLGELTSSYNGVRGNFLVYNSRFIDPSWAFAMNWNYCLQWIVAIPICLVGASLTIQFWNQEINAVVWVVIFWVVLLAISIFGVKGYGYGESIFSIIKVTAIGGFIILGIILTAGGGKQGYIGGKNWNPPFVHHIQGFSSTLVNAAFAFSGTELTAIAAAETPNPRKTLNKVIKQNFWRILIFYLLSMIMVCFLIRYDDPALMGNSRWPVSPYVLAISNSGIRVLPSIMNAVVLIALLSAANASVFATYKPLVALAEAGHGPKFLAYVDQKGRPVYSIAIAVAFGLIGLVSASPNGSTEVFNWMLSLSGLSCMFVWISISLAQIRVNYACKVQGIDKNNVPFKAFGGDYGAYLSIIINVVILIAQFYVALFPVNGESLSA